MPASQAVAGPGWSLKQAGTEIAEVLDIKGIGATADTDDVTNQSSPSFYKEKITTLLDGGDPTFECNYVPGNSTQIALLTALQGRGVVAFTLTPPGGGGSFAFDARVSEWMLNAPYSKKATLDIKLAITGPVTVT